LAAPSKILFTGQRIHPDGSVWCPVCDSTVQPNSTGWFDRFQKQYGEKGAYVHFKCLSEQRKQEIEDSMANKRVQLNAEGVSQAGETAEN
jgi:hypothetical protein